jgi:hypothetical protein
MRLTDFIIQKCMDGYHFNFECKGKGRSYELSYELLCSKRPDNPDDCYTWSNTKHSVGDTVMETVYSIFADGSSCEDELDDKLKLWMGKCWNIGIGFDWDVVKGLVITGSARYVVQDGSEEEYERSRESHRHVRANSLDELLHTLFVDYDPFNEYELEVQRDMENLFGKKTS